MSALAPVNVRFLIATCLMVCLLSSAGAWANIVTKPHFKIDGLVIVWGVSETTETSAQSVAQIGQSLSIEPAIAQAPATSLPQHPVVTGQFAPVEQIALEPLSDTQMHFYVASNTAFSIDAQWLNHGESAADAVAATKLALKVSLGGRGDVPFGQSAQYPHKAGPQGGMASNPHALGDLKTRRRVFTGNQRTAARTGSIAEQSVRFDMVLANTVPTRHSPAPEIMFTVFVP